MFHLQIHYLVFATYMIIHVFLTVKTIHSISWKWRVHKFMEFRYFVLKSFLNCFKLFIKLFKFCLQERFPEFETHESTTRFEHSVSFIQHFFNVSAISNAKRNRIVVERFVSIGQCMSIGNFKGQSTLIHLRVLCCSSLRKKITNNERNRKT